MSENSKLQIKAVVRGRVQGVGYRAWTEQQAKLRGLTGYVMNLPDGTVEVLIEGEASDVIEMAQTLWIGPPLAQVDQVDMCTGGASHAYTDFSCRRGRW